MKLNTLRALIATIEEGSLRSGAKRMQVSQPALTKMVRELELELATTLLVRTSKGVLPTAQGKVLYERAQAACKELGTAVNEINQLGGKMVGHLHIGAVPLAVMLLIPETLRTFGREFPDIQLRVSEELYQAQMQRLRNGHVDIAVGGIPTGLSSGEFVVEPLLHTTMEVVVRRGSPLAQATSLQQLTTAKWVYTGASNDTGYAKLLFESNGLPAPPVATSDSRARVELTMAPTGGAGRPLPQQIATHPMAAPFLSIVPLAEGGFPLVVGAIVRSDAVLSPTIRHCIAHLHRAAHQLVK